MDGLEKKEYRLRVQDLQEKLYFMARVITETELTEREYIGIQHAVYRAVILSTFPKRVYKRKASFYYFYWDFT